MELENGKEEHNVECRMEACMWQEENVLLGRDLL